MATLSLDEVLDLVDDVAASVAGPAAPVVDGEGRWPVETMRALQERGLGGLVVPESAGGLGLGLEALAQVSERLGRACASSALCFGMHCVASAVIAAKATPEQRASYLEPIAAGVHLSTLTLSEPATGSHFWLPQTQLEAIDGGYLVNGTKTFVTNGGHADSYVVSTVAHPAAGPVGEFSCVVVTGDTAGLEWQAPWDGLGMRGNSSRSLVLRDVRIPAHALLGQAGDQIWYVFNVVTPYFLVAMAGTYLGIAAAALDDAVAHASRRRYGHDGSRLAERPVVQHRIGTMWAKVERARQLLRFAAGTGDRGDARALPALASAKAEVAETAVEVVNDAMTVAGGIGYAHDAAMGRRLRDARAADVMSPTTDLLRLWTGRYLLGEHLLGD